jgi:RNA-directed DNA polymerase
MEDGYTGYPMTVFEQVCYFENLLRAYRQAARGKRSREDVIRFDYQLEWQLLRLRDQLRAGTYHPGPYHSFTITDPKPRRISAAPFADRVVHHAVVNVLEPLFERRFINGASCE